MIKTADIVHLGESYQLKIASGIGGIKDEWSQLSNKTIFAGVEYLELLEEYGPIGYKYYYAILLKNEIPQTAFYFQKKRVELSKDFRVHTHSNSFFDKMKVAFLKRFFKFVNHEILICGNVLLTGEFAYGPTHLFEPNSQIFDTIFKSTVDFIQQIDKVKVQSILCKDYYKEGPHKILSFKASGFYEFEVQPTMIVNVNPEWKSLDDYLGAVKSKYRVKFKKVIKKSGGLEFKRMSINDAEKYNDAMYALYKRTADRATFSLFTLNEKYFYKLKETLKENLQLLGVFKEDQILGFFTFVKDNDHGDAHFLGYNVNENSKYQLYFNMLLRLVEESISQGSSSLNLSRTALEIKSSVGAEPHAMYVYLKHLNPIINKLLPFILDRVVPENNWEQRRPFK
ncbi:MAG: GNAT family N-acetyltransferase [Saprospiraceae bacterium]|nr:GNAT family N-acetyltransferase [Bacteroidia bacterium]NNL91636.1 GNAT family N-acetyltransferase [Saprospiraceae bacterium]